MAASDRNRFVESMVALASAPDDDLRRALLALESLRGKANIAPDTVSEAIAKVAPELSGTLTQIVMLSIEAPSNQALVDNVVSIASTTTDLPPAVLELLRERLRAVVTIGLNQELKGFLLASEYERLYTSAAVFTDIRPIYDRESSSVRSHLIVHQLKIRYQELAGNRELYVAATDSELRQLAADIEVALQSAQGLRARLGDCLGQERILDSENDDDD